MNSHVESPQDLDGDALFNRRAMLRDRLLAVMGDFPEEWQHDRIQMDVLQIDQDEGFERRLIRFTGGGRIPPCPAYLLIPYRLKRPTPAVLCLHPTSPEGKKVPLGMSNPQNQHYGRELASNGYVVLTPDYPSMGDYHPPLDLLPSATLLAILNNRQALHLLAAMEEVDETRLAAIGHSLGGHNAIFTAALEPRLKVVVSNCGFTSFRRYRGGDLTRWAQAKYMPRVQTHYDADPRRLPFDFSDCLELIAPQAFLAISPLYDSNFSPEGVRETIYAVAPLYEQFGCSQRIHSVFPDCAHEFHIDMRRHAYEFIASHFGETRNFHVWDE